MKTPSNKVRRAAVPEGTILHSSRPLSGPARDETHLDCFVADIDGAWSLEQFVGVFYRTWLFRAERFVLKHVMRLPSTDSDLESLLDGNQEKFAAWSIERRTANELLMCDIASKTKSWFMVTQTGDSAKQRTLVHFGTVVVATPDRRSGEPKLGTLFRLFMPLHLLYARSLLLVAVRDLRSAAAR